MSKVLIGALALSLVAPVAGLALAQAMSRPEPAAPMVADLDRALGAAKAIPAGSRHAFLGDGAPMTPPLRGRRLEADSIGR